MEFIVIIICAVCFLGGVCLGAILNNNDPYQQD